MKIVPCRNNRYRKLSSVEPFAETSVLTFASLGVAGVGAVSRGNREARSPGPVEGALPLLLGEAPGLCNELYCA